jgi:acetyl esterase/lipase
MPSLQHHMLRVALSGTSLVVGLRTLDVTALRNLLDLGSLFTLLPWGIRAEKLRLKHLKAEWLRSSTSSNHHAILYLHGGGFALGSPYTHRSMVGQIVQLSDVDALVINYRKIPENPFPAAIDDALEAYKYLLEQGYSAENIVVAGDSAGGGLALSFQLKLKELQLPLPGGSVLISPWANLAVEGESVEKNHLHDPFIRLDKMREFGVQYAGNNSITDPLVSPIYGDFTGFGPMLIQASKGETLHSDALALANKAREAGVEVNLQEWEGLVHWWHFFWRILPEAESALHHISRFGFLNKNFRNADQQRQQSA